jgi:hypothetical protein
LTNKTRQASITNEILEIVGGSIERIRKKISLFFKSSNREALDKRKISLFFKS